jgi:hypothetical protein
MMMDPKRQFWNQHQQTLRQSLSQANNHVLAIEIFMQQHAMLHTAEMSRAGLWSFEDEVVDGLSEAQMRRIPPREDHSIAWILWHLTRIEDVTMNLLVSGSPQVLDGQPWLERMQTGVCDTGNSMTFAQIAELSATINLGELRAYRLSVGRRTRAIAKLLQPEQLKQKVDSSRLEQVTRSGAVPESASGLLDYWGGLTVAGLLLMPPTRHTFIHWNEAQRLIQKKAERADLRINRD